MDGAAGQIEAALSRADPDLGRVIDAVVAQIGRLHVPSSQTTPFHALVRAIVYQSVSAKAAATIHRRLEQTVGELTPCGVLALQHEVMRAVGLSSAKAASIAALARWFDANPGIAARLRSMPNEGIIAALDGIPGIGLWTINVFLIFNLGRTDVVPASDLAIRRAAQLAYGLDRLATPALVHEKARSWQPHASLASIYLWNAVRLKLTAEDLR